MKAEEVTTFPEDPWRDVAETYEAYYDREGRLIWEETRSVPGDAERYALSAYTRRGEYTYDLLGRCTEIKWVYDYPLASSMESYATREVITYQTDGTPESSVLYRKSPTDPGWKVSYSQQFDENGLTAVKVSDPDGRRVESIYTYTYFYK